MRLGGMSSLILHRDGQDIDTIIVNLLSNIKGARATLVVKTYLDKLRCDILGIVETSANQLNSLRIEILILKAEANICSILVCATIVSRFRNPINCIGRFLDLCIDCKLVGLILSHCVAGFITIVNRYNVIRIIRQCECTNMGIYATVRPRSCQRLCCTAISGNQHRNVVCIEVCLIDCDRSVDVAIIVGNAIFLINGRVVSNCCSRRDIIYDNTLTLRLLNYVAGTVNDVKFHSSVKLVVAAENHLGNLKGHASCFTAIGVFDISFIYSLIQKLGVD